jgi:hypothetical protein
MIKCFAVCGYRKKRARQTAKPARKSGQMLDFNPFYFSITFQHSLNPIPKLSIAL